MAKKSAEHKAQLGQTAAEKGGHFWKVGLVGLLRLCGVVRGCAHTGERGCNAALYR